eukprot:scaffold1359_cov76-Cyclotella_meneghiniana.AAC.4
MTTTQRSTTWTPATTTICSDGTTCENSSTCLPHPIHEGSYICDCLSSPLSSGPFAGLYCEHAATTLCTNAPTNHAFCTNGGECKNYVGKKEIHGGCKCQRGYTGEYCQFIEGSVPSDWEVLNYPSIAAARVGVTGGMAGGKVAGIVMGTFMGLACIFGMLFLSIYTGKLAMRIPYSFGDKELDTNSNENDEFIGGKSVYIKRRSTKTANSLMVSPEMLEADGSVLTDAIAMSSGQEDEDAIDNESPTKGGSIGLQEVDLDDLKSSLDQDHKTDDVNDVQELPSIA